MQGWIKLNRNITSTDIYRLEKFSKGQALVDLLLKAGHKPHSVQIRNIVIELNEGELCYSKKQLAATWKWSERRVTAFLDYLKLHKIIDYKVIFHVTTVIRILNDFSGDKCTAEIFYPKNDDVFNATQTYSLDNLLNNNDLENSGTTPQSTPQDTPQSTQHPPFFNGNAAQTKAQIMEQVANKQECKIINNNVYINGEAIFIPEILSKQECFNETLLAYIEMRKAIKRPILSSTIFPVMFDHLLILQNQGHDPVSCLKQSVINNYCNIFKPKLMEY